MGRLLTTIWVDGIGVYWTQAGGLFIYWYAVGDDGAWYSPIAYGEL